jgi:hypothetical protein
MLNAIVQAFVAMFGGAVGQKVGGAVVNVASLAALAPLALWLLGEDSNAIALTVTWRELAALGALLFVVLKAGHYTPPPPPSVRRDWRDDVP